MIDVSIIIPAYNASNTIERAIESASRQKNVEIEIICVDDGSSDNTKDILDRSKEKYNNLEIFRQKNQGAGAARNLGIQVAKGQYVAFLDADDYYIDEMALFHMVQKCRQYNVKVCRSAMSLEEDNVIRFSSSYGAIIDEASRERVDYLESQNDYDFFTYIYSREMLVDNDIYFPTWRYFEDPPFLAKALFTAKSYVVCEDSLYCYVVPRQVAKINSKEKVVDLVRGLQQNIVFSLDNDLKTLLHRTINRLLYEYGDVIYHNQSDAMVDNIEATQRLLLANGYTINFNRLFTRSYTDYESFLVSRVIKSNNIYIFGHGKNSEYFTRYFLKSFDKNKFKGYVVSDEKHKSDGDISLIEYSQMDDRGLLIIAVSGIYVGEIIESLEKFQIENYDVLDMVFLNEIKVNT